MSVPFLIVRRNLRYTTSAAGQKSKRIIVTISFTLCIKSVVMLQPLLMKLYSSCQITFVTPPKEIICSIFDPKPFSLPPLSLTNCHYHHDQNEVLCVPLISAIYAKFTCVTAHVQVVVCYGQTEWIVE